MSGFKKTGPARKAPKHGRPSGPARGDAPLPFPPQRGDPEPRRRTVERGRDDGRPPEWPDREWR